MNNIYICNKPVGLTSKDFADLIKEKDDINLLVKEKDSKIKKILVQLEQANDDVQAMGKKIGELESKLKKKSEIKKNKNLFSQRFEQSEI